MNNDDVSVVLALALAITNGIWFLYTLFLHGAYNEFKTSMINELFNRIPNEADDVSDRD